VAGVTSNGQNSLNGADSGISVGRYLDDSALFYFSFGYRDLTGTSTITQGSTVTTLNDTGVQRISAVGLRFELEAFYLGVEYGRGTTTWTRASDSWNDFTGFATGFRW